MGITLTPVQAVTNWSVADIQAGLLIAVLVGLIVILYHVLFIVVDLRKILRRVGRLTEEIEAVVQRPLAVTDKLLKWVIHFIEAASDEHHAHRRKTKH